MQTEDCRPTLLLMAGPPGAGKTTLALALGRELGWPVLDKDTVKTAMMEAGVAEDIAGPASYYLPLALCQDLLVQQRLSVILDSPAAYASVLVRAQQIAIAGEGQLKIIFCEANSGLRNQRLALRLRRLSQRQTDPTPDDQTRRQFGHLPDTKLVLQMHHSLPALVAEALEFVL